MIGQSVEVMILDVDQERERVSLGLKQTTNNPWDDIERKFPVGRQDPRQGRQPRSLRCVRRTRARCRRPRARLRTVLDQAHHQALRRAQGRPGNRSGRSRHPERRAEDLPRCPPARAEPVGRWCATTTRWAPASRARSATSPLRRLRRTRRRHRRHGARFRHVLDPQDQPPVRSPQEGRRSRRHRARHRQGAPAHLPRHEAARGRSVERHRRCFKVGDLVKGTVAKIASFGAFVGSKDDIDGLVHISQISEEHVEKIKDVIKAGTRSRPRSSAWTARTAPSRCRSRPRTTPGAVPPQGLLP